MLFGKSFRKSSQRHPQPKWVKWMILALLVYIVANALWRGPEGSQRNSLQEALDTAGEEIMGQKTITFSQYRGRLFPEYNSELKLLEVKRGSGAVALCGQDVRLTYESFTSTDKPIEKSKSLAFTIGAGKVMPAIEQAVIGMQPGGTRSAKTNMAMSYGLPEYVRMDLSSDQEIRFELKLESIQPVVDPAIMKPYRVVEVKPGYGEPVTCGNPVHMNVIMWDVTAKELFSTVKPVTAQEPQPAPQGLRFTPGRAEVFLGLEQGVIGMTPGSVRTLVVPPALQKPLGGKKPTIDFPFPANQTVLVDVEYLP